MTQGIGPVNFTFKEALRLLFALSLLAFCWVIEMLLFIPTVIVVQIRDTFRNIWLHLKQNKKGHGYAPPYWLFMPVLMCVTNIGKLTFILCIVAVCIYRAIKYPIESVIKNSIMSVIQGILLFISIILIDMLIFYIIGFSVLGHLV